MRARPWGEAPGHIQHGCRDRSKGKAAQRRQGERTEGSNSEVKINNVPSSFPVEKLLQLLLCPHQHPLLPAGQEFSPRSGQKLPLPLVTHQTSPRQKILQKRHVR